MSAATDSPAVSVVIPTFNGHRFLHLVLESLAAQTLPPHQFEVIVVDNNSTIDVFASEKTQASLQLLESKGIRFRTVRESRQGLTFARSAGLRAAAAPVVNYLDDDNEPSPGYLEAGLAALTDPSVGILVSRVAPVFYEAPSPAVLRRRHLFAINDAAGPSPIRWEPAQVMCSTLGAGLWIRTPLLESIFRDHQDSLLPDRIGTDLICGGDIELGILTGRKGFARLYVPDLTIRHHIPENRVQPGYVVRLIQGVIRSQMALDWKYLGREPSKLRGGVNLLGAVGVGWIPALLRGDAAREYRFIVGAAFSRFLGPYRVEAGPGR